MKSNKSLVWSKITFYSVISRAVNVAMRWVYQEPSHSVIFALTYLSLYSAKVGRCFAHSLPLTIISLVNYNTNVLYTHLTQQLLPMFSSINNTISFHNFYDIGLMSYYLYIFNLIKKRLLREFFYADFSFRSILSSITTNSPNRFLKSV